jgi:hypothetical protein
MQNICPKCHINPNAHSFKILRSNNKDDIKHTIFYTCPSEAEEYNDSDGILLHYENMLKMNGDKGWIWIFNCNKMEIKHSLELNTCRRIAQLISDKYMHNIKQIYIININFALNIIMNFLWPFLSDKLKDLIIITDKLPFEINVDTANK